MTLYATNPRFDSTRWTFDVALLPQFLVGVSCSWGKGWHVALHLGPLVVMLWRVTL